VAGFDAPLEGEAFFGTALSDADRILLDASDSGARVKLEGLLEPEFEGLPRFWNSQNRRKSRSEISN
jgi:hypothetical protein